MLWYIRNGEGGRGEGGGGRGEYLSVPSDAFRIAEYTKI